jgi:hypothetical protein
MSWRGCTGAGARCVRRFGGTALSGRKLRTATGAGEKDDVHDASIVSESIKQFESQ